MIEKLIKHLQNKHNAFIGSQKDQVRSSEAKGFKQGLEWAIESAETMIRNAKAEHEYNLEQEENNYSEKPNSQFYCNDEKHYPEIGRCKTECKMCEEEKLKNATKR